MSTTQGTVIDVICSSYEQFFEAEKKIATYIINHPQQVLDMTVSDLAAASGGSEATISRFCRKCGMKGFHHLKINLAQSLAGGNELDQHLSNKITRANIPQSLQNILKNKIEELTQTVSMMDPRDLDQILTYIQTARIVQFAAVGNTIPVAQDGAYKFSQIGITATTSSIWETQLAFAYTLTDRDVAILISNSGASKRLLDVAKGANTNGAITIGITNSAASPLARLCRYHITTATREKLFLENYYFSRVSAMTVVEILYLFLSASQKDSYTHTSQHEQTIASEKI
jgi:Transcriptional regulators